MKTQAIKKILEIIEDHGCVDIRDLYLESGLNQIVLDNLLKEMLADKVITYYPDESYEGIGCPRQLFVKEA